MRRSAAIMLLAVTVFGSLRVGKDTYAYYEWRKSVIELLQGQQLRSALRNLVTQNSGEEVLPSLVRDMLALLRRQDIQEYAISPGISANWEFHVRIIKLAFAEKDGADRALSTSVSRRAPPSGMPATRSRRGG